MLAYLMQWGVWLGGILAAAHEHPGTADPGSSGSMLRSLFQVFVPRQQCMNYEPDVIWLHVISDGLIALSYFSIPVALFAFVRRRKDLEFSWMYVLFALFILSCGTTHAFGVWDMWQPLYRLDGLMKAFTAATSVMAAALLWPLLPRALALPSPAQLRQANEELARQVAERERAQSALKQLTGDLEMRVQERTAELERVNAEMRSEIAARKAAEAERNRLLESERGARAEAEYASRMKDEFLATLSHELRTPLNAIVGWTHLLRSGSAGPEELNHGMEIIERNARVQTQLVEDLLDMSRIVAGKIRLDIQTVDLGRIVDNAMASVRPAAEGKGVRLEKKSPPGKHLTRADNARLQQVIWNLLTNAIKFTPRGGTVEVEIRQEASQLEVSVKDTGRGIPPVFLPYVFDRFRQADSTTTREHGGLGLGLAIVKNLVELHGGTVEAHSAGEGKGAQFRVLLPVAPLQPAPAGSAVEVEAETGGRPRLDGVRVLVVDDDPDSRELLRRVLEERGSVVTIAASAMEAMELIRQSRPDVLLSDVGMPEHDGYELIRWVRTLEAGTGESLPAAALTAFARSEDRTRALLAGFHIHVPKPAEPAELVAVVARLARRR